MAPPLKVFFVPKKKAGESVVSKHVITRLVVNKMEHCGGPLSRVWMQIYTIYCQINDDVTNNSLELRSLTKSPWMRSNSAKLRASSLFFR